MSTGISALVLGASGAIGKALLSELTNHPTFTKITLITRRQLDIDNPKVEQKIVDFEKLEDYKDSFSDIQVS